MWCSIVGCQPDNHAVLDAMKMKCFFELNKEKLQKQWDEAGLSSLLYIITVLVLYFILLGLIILIQTYKVDTKLFQDDKLLIRTLFRTVDQFIQMI